MPPLLQAFRNDRHEPFRHDISLSPEPAKMTPVTITLRTAYDDVRTLVLSPNKSVIIGRASKSRDKKLQVSSANALFDCPVVSRYHAELHLHTVNGESEVSIKDVGSTHGTKVNNTQLGEGFELELNNGDKIQLGEKVNRGDNSHEGVTVTFNRSPSSNSQMSHTMRSSQPSRSFCVPADSESEDLQYSSDEELSVVRVMEKALPPNKSKPESGKAKLGSSSAPIDLDKAPGQPHQTTVIDLDSENEEELTRPSLPPRSPSLPPRSTAVASGEKSGEQDSLFVPDTFDDDLSVYAMDTETGYSLPPLAPRSQVPNTASQPPMSIEELKRHTPNPGRYDPYSDEEDDDDSGFSVRDDHSRAGAEEDEEAEDDDSSVMSSTGRPPLPARPYSPIHFARPSADSASALAGSQRRVEEVYMHNFGRPLPKDHPSSATHGYHPAPPPQKSSLPIPSISPGGYAAIQQPLVSSWATTSATQNSNDSASAQGNLYTPFDFTYHTAPLSSSWLDPLPIVTQSPEHPNSGFGYPKTQGPGRVTLNTNDNSSHDLTSAAEGSHSYTHTPYFDPFNEHVSTRYHDFNSQKPFTAPKPISSKTTGGSPKVTRINISDIVDKSVAGETIKSPLKSVTFADDNSSHESMAVREPLPSLIVKLGMKPNASKVLIEKSNAKPADAETSSVLPMDSEVMGGKKRKADEMLEAACKVGPEARKQLPAHKRLKKADSKLRSGHRIKEAAKITTGMLVGSAATFMFLCSPLAEKAIEWLA